MANKFKYNKTGSETDSLFKGNWAIDTTAPNSGGGPSATTGLYAGANIPQGGYAVYNSEWVFVANNDRELLDVLNSLGANADSASEALKWVLGQADYMVLNKSFDDIATDGLVLNMDASYVSSFVDSEPTTNLWTGSLYNWTQGATMTRNFTEIAPYDANYEVVRIESNTPGNIGMAIPWTTFLPAPVIGDLYTHTAWMYLESGTYCKVGQHWNPWDYGTPNYIPLRTWTKVSYTLSLVDTSHTSIANNYSTDGVVYVTMPQYEKQATATPFVYGTRAQNTDWYDIGSPSSSTTEYTLYGLTYPESSQTPASREGITPGRDNITGAKLYHASRDINYYVFDEDTNAWLDDSFFNGERAAGHCYDTYDGQPNQHEQFNADFDAIHAAFPNAAHIIIASHAAERFWTNTGMLQRLQSIGLPDGIAGNSRPEFILVGKVDKPWLTKFAYENVSSAVAHMNLSLPLEGRKLKVIGDPTYDTNGQFTLNETQGFQTLKMPTNSTTASVSIWYKTTDQRELWVKGQSGSHYIAASNSGGNYYHEGSGSPTYYIDTVQSINPTTSRNGLWHMFEAKNVNFSGWNQMNWFLYGSSWNMNGSVAKIRVYDRSITAEESKQNYYGGPIVTDSLVLALDAGNLVSYENGSDTAYNLAGSDAGTLTNGIGFDSNNGGSWTFDGVDDYITLPSSLDSLHGSTEASLEMWVKLNSNSNSVANTGIIQLSGYSNGNGNLYWYQNGYTYLDIFITTRYRVWSNAVLDPRNWHMLTITTTSGTNGWKAYLNGILQFQTTGQSTVSVDSTIVGGLTLGENSGGRCTNGNIASTKIYNKALTADEVTQNFSAQRNRFGI